MWPGRITNIVQLEDPVMMFSMPASAKPFLNCSSFGNFKVSFLLELDLAKPTESFSRVCCEMASFKLKNKSEKCFSPESHGHSAPAAAAGCRAPLPLSGCPCLCAVMWAGARSRPHRVTERILCADTQVGRPGVCSQPFSSFLWRKPERHCSQSRTPAPHQAFVSTRLLQCFPLFLGTLSPLLCTVFYTRTQETCYIPYPQNRGGHRMTSEVK